MYQPLRSSDSSDDLRLGGAAPNSSLIQKIVATYSPLLERIADEGHRATGRQKLFEYAAAAASRGGLKAEDTLLKSFLGVYGQRWFSFRASLDLVDAFSSMVPAPSSENFSELADLVVKIGARAKPAAIRGSVEAFRSFAGHLSGPSGWINLALALAESSASKGLVLRTLRGVSRWEETSHIPSATSAEGDARAALLGYALTRRISLDQLAALVETRVQYPSRLSDQMRVAVLTCGAHSPAFPRHEQTAMALTSITRIERLSGRSPGILNDSAYITRRLGDDLAAIGQFFLGCSTEREVTLEQRISNAATLFRAGADISCLPFGVTNILSSLLDRTVEDSSERKAVLRLTSGLSSFTKRVLDREQEEGWQSRLKEAVVRIAELENEDGSHETISALGQLILGDPRNFRKLCLVLEGHGLPPESKMRTFSALQGLITELRAHAVITELLVTRDESRRRRLHSTFSSSAVAYKDNPPFSWNAASPEEKNRFVAQVNRAYRLQVDGYYGFWAHTHAFRHSPVSRRCSFDEFAMRVAGKDRLKVLPAADFNLAPGRGRILNGILPELIFATDRADAHRDPLHRWKKDILGEFGKDEYSNSKIIHPLDYLPDARFVFLRLQRAFVPPSHREFSFEGEHLTHVTYNHHFDASGAYYSIFVPTRAYLSFIEPFAVPYDGTPESFRGRPGAGDICAYPPTVENLRQRCLEMGTSVGVIDLGWGSNFGGGLCNGFFPGSRPLHAWENETRNRNWFDGFGHPHKYNIKDRADILARLNYAHERLYTMLMNAENAWNVFKAAESIDACGFSIPGVRLRRQDDDQLSELGMGESSPWNLDLPDFGSESDGPAPEFVLEDLGALPENSAKRKQRQHLYARRTLPKLEEITRLAHEYRASATPRKDSPILVLANGFSYGQVPETPFVVDSGAGIVWRRSGRPIFFNQLDGEIPDEVREWWLKEVAPLLVHNPFRPPRVVARDNYLSQMREMGATGSV